MEVEYPSRTPFDMSDALDSINNGVSRLNIDQLFPINGNVANDTAVGTGSASGTTTFQFNETTNWWCPSQSYFFMRLKFTYNNTVIDNLPALGTPDAAGKLITYCDNFICTLFTQIQSQINSQPLDTVTTPWIVDTALGYSKAHWNFIKTYSSMTRMGEGLHTRLLNVSQNGGYVDVAFRPPLSLFDVKILPPGAQFRVDFLWAANGLGAFESLRKNPLTWGAGATDNQVLVSTFSFYKASYQPAPGLQLPKQGVIDLCPAVANQYYINNSSQTQAQITLPGTTNRILVVFQDNNTVSTVSDAGGAPINRLTGIGGGFNPITSFSSIFLLSDATSSATFSNVCRLVNLWLSLPEIGVTEPKPQYQFTSQNYDMMRAYSDWAHTCQGTIFNYEGSLPYGNNDPSKGTQVLYLDTDGAATANIVQPGDINNYQQYNYWISTTTDPPAGTALAYNQTSRWGWSGTRPGPIFAFPVVRPEYKQVTQGTLYVTLDGTCKSVSATVIASYSMALAVQDVGNGLYEYKLITGV